MRAIEPPRFGRAVPILPHRYESLDALRGICALCVCLFHFKANSPVTDFWFVRNSWLFVDFFFVLSGFVIAAGYRDRLIAGMPLKSFIILRLGRIYPLHFVLLLVLVATECAGLLLSVRGEHQRQMFDGAHSVAAIFTNLTLTQSFGLHPTLTWNQPAWSIATEFWAYVLFALAAHWAGPKLDRCLLIAVAVCGLVILLVNPRGINVSHDWGMLRCIYGFAMGALAWQVWQSAGLRPAAAGGSATATELAMLAAVVGFVAYAGSTRFDLLAPQLFAATVLVFARQAGAVSRLLVTPPLLRLGVLSYSIYMVHLFVQSRFDDVLRLAGRVTGQTFLLRRPVGDHMVTVIGTTPLQGTIFIVVMLAVVVAVSYFTWRYIEMPGQRWGKRLAARVSVGEGTRVIA